MTATTTTKKTVGIRDTETWPCAGWRHSRKKGARARWSRHFVVVFVYFFGCHCCCNLSLIWSRKTPEIKTIQMAFFAPRHTGRHAAGAHHHAHATPRHDARHRFLPKVPSFRPIIRPVGSDVRNILPLRRCSVQRQGRTKRQPRTKGRERKLTLQRHRPASQPASDRSRTNRATDTMHERQFQELTSRLAHLLWPY